MKLWLISQGVNNSYDTYDAAVVCAATEDEARHTCPGPGAISSIGNLWIGWCDPEYVRVEYLGEARDRMPAGVVLASFNAG